MDITEPLSSDPVPVILQSGMYFSDWMFYIITLLLLFGCSALFSASEVAFFALSPSDKDELKADGTRRSKQTLNLLDKPKDLLATILIANNLVNVCIIIISTGFINMLYPIHTDNHTVRFLIEVIGITLLLLLLGEVAPKIYASRNTKFAARFMAGPLTLLNVLPPISWIRLFLVSGTNLLKRRAGKRGINLSSDDLEQAL
ncbi:MAG: DUF21 domain-containing protein, partial [Flavobacteriia bacterium]|nr:DUF21 domain-containing protein [Flavobacteriia bacterium]